jgi:HNH endonuclease
MGKRKPLAERFWSRVEKNGPVPPERPDLGPCWLWTGTPNQDGYGTINVWEPDAQPFPRYLPRYVHRVSYEMEHGPIAAGYEVDHLCWVRNCVNPAHLEAVTVAEHRRRRRAGQRGGPTWIKERTPEEMPVHMRPAEICRKGLHAMTGDNVLTERSGLRRCRACKRERQRREYQEGRHPSSPKAVAG